MYSFSLNYALHGFAMLWPWHVVNIAAHLLCGILVYALVLKTRFGRQNRALALLAAVLFLVHPMCTEPVLRVVTKGA